MIGQTVVAVVFGVLAHLADGWRTTTAARPASHHISFLRDIRRARPARRSWSSLLIWVIVAGISNGVNLTDGLDGLATGASMMVFGAYTLVNIWQSNQFCQDRARPRKCYDVRDPLDLAVVAAAITGACFGFLWWNASPAADLHGRHRLARPRRRARRPRDPDPHRAAAGHPRRAVRRRDALGDHPGRLLQAHQGADGSSGWRRCTTTSRCSGWEQVTIVIRFWIIAGLCVAAGLGHLLRRVGRRLVSAPAVGSRRARSPRLLGRASARSSPGFGVSGFAAADNLLHLGAEVTAARRGRPPTSKAEKAELLEVLGADVRLGPGATATLPDDVDLVVTSPGLAARPRRCSPQAAARGVPVWGEVELAWRLRDPERPRAVARRHRHQRQDDDRADARRDPARRRAAQRRRRQRRPADRRGGDGPRAVRRARRRAVQLPAALHRTRWPPSRPPCSTSPRTTSTGTRALGGATPPTRAGSTSGVAARLRLQRRRPGDRAAGARGRRGRGRPGGRLHPRHARRSACVGLVEDILVDRAFIERARHQRRRARARSTTSPRPRRTSSPTPSPPPRWPARTA